MPAGGKPAGFVDLFAQINLLAFLRILGEMQQLLVVTLQTSEQQRGRAIQRAGEFN